MQTLCASCWQCLVRLLCWTRTCSHIHLEEYVNQRKHFAVTDTLSAILPWCCELMDADSFWPLRNSFAQSGSCSGSLRHSIQTHQFVCLLDGKLVRFCDDFESCSLYSCEKLFPAHSLLFSTSIFFLEFSAKEVVKEIKQMAFSLFEKTTVQLIICNCLYYDNLQMK